MVVSNHACKARLIMTAMLPIIIVYVLQLPKGRPVSLWFAIVDRHRLYDRAETASL